MKRLTEKGFDFSTQFVTSHLQSYPIAQALERLQAYEDSGLTAERARELGLADAEGRVVILPCEVGDIVYSIFCNEVIERTIDRIIVNRFTSPQIWVEIGCAFTTSTMVRWDLTVGKYFYLTRAEAEAALAKMKEIDDGQA